MPVSTILQLLVKFLEQLGNLWKETLGTKTPFETFARVHALRPVDKLAALALVV